MAEETVVILSPIDLNAKHANLDVLYGPYDSIQDAIAAIPGRFWDGEEHQDGYRSVGLTFAVYDTPARTTVTEYWFSGGVGDSDITRKIVIPTYDSSIGANPQSTNAPTTAAVYAYVDERIRNMEGEIVSELLTI